MIIAFKKNNNKIIVNIGTLGVDEYGSICLKVEWLRKYSGSRSVLASVEIVVDTVRGVCVCVCVCVLEEKNMKWFNEKQLLKLLELVDLHALENAWDTKKMSYKF